MSALRTGWEPDTPDEDMLLRQAVYNFTDFNAGISEALGARVRWTEDVAMADLGRPGEFLNSATFLRPPLGRIDTVMDEIEAFFTSDGTGHIDLWSAWPTPDLGARGWDLQGHPPLMYRPAGVEHALVAQRLEVREVVDGLDLAAFELAVKIGFGAPPDAPSLLDERVLDLPRLGFWCGHLDGEVVGTAAVCVSRGVNGVQMITTAPEFRGRGFGEAMTWKATTADPSAPAVLLASDLGRPVYERMGYRTLLRFTYWRRERP
jgi:hypothetical protein